MAEKLILNNRLTYYSVIVLTFYFFVIFGLVILPKLPQPPEELGEWRIAMSSWNLGGSLMFTLVFRIQLLRGISDRLNKMESKMHVTPWVWFWFAGLAVIGSLSSVALIYSYLSPGIFSASEGSKGVHDFLTIFSIILWAMLIALSISLLRIRDKCHKKSSKEIEKALRTHRWLLAPSTVAFFIFSVVVAPTSFFFI